MAIWQTVITVLATLAGTITGTVLTSVLKSRSDRVARVHEWQVEVVKIYGDLMTALSDHYAAMWDLEAARNRGDQAEIATTLAASLPTRSAITRPHVQLVVLAPMLRTEIDAAVHAVYAMDTATDDTARTPDQLTARRHTAKTAMATLSTATARVLAGLGAGLPGSPIEGIPATPGAVRRRHINPTKFGESRVAPAAARCCTCPPGADAPGRSRAG